MKNVSPESFLNETEENFEITYSDISAIEKKPRLGYSSEIMDIYTDDLKEPKHSFVISIRPRFNEEFVEFINSVLSDKI
jgi:predicted double-glycine peptidase